MPRSLLRLVRLAHAEAVVLDLVAGDVHERLLERRAHGRQLVQDDPVRAAASPICSAVSPSTSSAPSSTARP